MNLDKHAEETKEIRIQAEQQAWQRNQVPLINRSKNAMQLTKQDALEAIGKLPDDADYDEIM